MQKTVMRFVRIVIAATLVLNGYMQITGQSTALANTAVTENKTEIIPVYKGKVVEISNKAKIILIQVGEGDDSQTIVVNFDKNTVGVENATKGHGVIISYEKREKITYAKSIKPKLAKLPKGVSLLQTAELKEIITKGTEIVLVDSRPTTRYSQSHLPGAISIPASDIQELIDLLPKDKNAGLVFYCGGPT